VSYLAVDVGGTATRAVVVERDGRCIGYGTAGRGNPTSAGSADAASAIVAATTAALGAAGRRADDVVAAVAGIAGAGTPAGAVLRQALAAAALPEIAFEPDVLATYHSGTLAADGYAVVAGTGAVASRIRGSQIDITCDGLGWLLGDGGSGFWIGRRVVRATASALDGRSPMSALVDLVLADIGTDARPEAGEDGRPIALRQLLDAVYQREPVALARFAPLAFAAAARGDDAARRIVADAAAALATTMSTIASAEVVGPIVLGGSILAQQPAIAEAVVAAAQRCGVAGPVSTVPDGMAGAAVLALRHGGANLDEAVFTRIRTTLAALR
jgi:N-acetylglucosamine kinase-like BadF-type ATPase